MGKKIFLSHGQKIIVFDGQTIFVSDEQEHIYILRANNILYLIGKKNIFIQWKNICI